MVCESCGRTLNERNETVWNLVEGWEKRRDQGGTNHLALRKPKEVFRCNGCMTLLQQGLSPGQRALL